MGRKVVFIHGAWVGPGCWDSFRMRFADRGYECLAPAWPHDDRPVEELLASPDPELAGVGIGEIVDHYATVIQGLDEPPILVGHSFGGLFVQMLMDRGLGVAGVALDAAPPRGVLATPKAFRAAIGVLLTWRGWMKVIQPSYKAFSWGFVHALPESARREAFNRYVIPTPGRPFFQAAFGKANRVDWTNSKRGPLLLTAGGMDRTVPKQMNRANYKKYSRSSAITELKEFPERTHWLIAEPGWDEVADYVLDWLGSKLDQP
jgi:pimeloyl-ACP methyl ester carboxylesterase